MQNVVTQSKCSKKIDSGVSNGAVEKVVVAEMQGRGGYSTDVFIHLDFRTVYDITVSKAIVTKKDFDVQLKKALLEEHLACWVCSKWWEPFISFLAS